MPRSTAGDTTSQYALVIVADRVDVRSGAGAHHPIVEAGFVDAGVPGSLPIALVHDELAWVLDDPVIVSGEAWYHVAFINRPYDDGRFLTGWIAAGEGDDPQVERHDASTGCSRLNARPQEVLGGIRRLACFGSEPIAVTGEIQPGDTPCNTHWLMCAAAYLTGDTGGPLPLYLDPANDIELPPAGAHAQVQGRLEHPSSSGCAIGAIDAERATAAVLYCRSRVVVESVTSLEPVAGEPAPVLEAVGMEALDSGWIRYSIRIANAADYPPELFAAAPDLPPCGASAHSARAWVDIVAESGDPITTFCALTGPVGLGDLFFTRMADLPSPAVYVEIIDRLKGFVFRSNIVRFEEP